METMWKFVQGIHNHPFSALQSLLCFTVCGIMDNGVEYGCNLFNTLNSLVKLVLKEVVFPLYGMEI